MTNSKLNNQQWAKPRHWRATVLAFTMVGQQRASKATNQRQWRRSLDQRWWIAFISLFVAAIKLYRQMMKTKNESIEPKWMQLLATFSIKTNGGDGEMNGNATVTQQRKRWPKATMTFRRWTSAFFYSAIIACVSPWTAITKDIPFNHYYSVLGGPFIWFADQILFLLLMDEISSCMTYPSLRFWLPT